MLFVLKTGNFRHPEKTTNGSVLAVAGSIVFAGLEVLMFFCWCVVCCFSIVCVVLVDCLFFCVNFLFVVVFLAKFLLFIFAGFIRPSFLPRLCVCSD